MGIHALGTQVRAAVATGARFIVVWSGSIGTIPVGWALCDGSGDTPDLRDSFIQNDNVLVVTGLSGTGIYTVSHDHPGTVPVVDDEAEPLHGHTLPFGDAKLAGGDWRSVLGSATATGGYEHTHTMASGTFLGTGTHDHGVTGLPEDVTLSIDPRPPYYALAYIKAEAAVTLPLGSIAQWDDFFDAPPTGYAVCDGSGGTPDLRGYLAQGVGANLGLLAKSTTTSLSADHAHASEYLATTTTHEHDYVGPVYPATDAYHNASDNFVTTGPPLGITADGHFHNMELHTDLTGGHGHTLTFDLADQTLHFSQGPITARLVTVMRVA